jgi:hypothetical protein
MFVWYLQLWKVENWIHISFHLKTEDLHFISFHFISIVKWVLMSINKAVREVFLFIFFEAQTRHWRRGRQGEGSVYWGPQTAAIEAKPAVKIQSASAAPGIATAPRSVLQVPMDGNVPTGSGGACASVSMNREEESRVQGVYEGELPGHCIVGIQCSGYVCARSWRCRGSWRGWGRWVVFEMRKKITRSERLICLQWLTFDIIQ